MPGSRHLLKRYFSINHPRRGKLDTHGRTQPPPMVFWRLDHRKNSCTVPIEARQKIERGEHRTLNEQERRNVMRRSK